MHYTGTIWRPPYEAGSLLLQVTAGCTHHKCKFCTLYADLPFPFRLSPRQELERDLLEVQTAGRDPISQLIARLNGIPTPKELHRVFLTGANPFVLRTEKLLAIADLIRQYLPKVETIGCFARVTDTEKKTDEDLLALRQAGYDGLTIGMETVPEFSQWVTWPRSMRPTTPPAWSFLPVMVPWFTERRMTALVW